MSDKSRFRILSSAQAQLMKLGYKAVREEQAIPHQMTKSLCELVDYLCMRLDMAEQLIGLVEEGRKNGNRRAVESYLRGLQTYKLATQETDLLDTPAKAQA